jgi:hypothetical protein
VPGHGNSLHKIAICAGSLEKPLPALAGKHREGGLGRFFDHLEQRSGAMARSLPSARISTIRPSAFNRTRSMRLLQR